jgi:hypothetical protein
MRRSTRRSLAVGRYDLGSSGESQALHLAVGPPFSHQVVELNRAAAVVLAGESRTRVRLSLVVVVTVSAFHQEAQIVDRLPLDGLAPTIA